MCDVAQLRLHEFVITINEVQDKIRENKATKMKELMEMYMKCSKSNIPTILQVNILVMLKIRNYYKTAEVAK